MDEHAMDAADQESALAHIKKFRKECPVCGSPRATLDTALRGTTVVVKGESGEKGEQRFTFRPDTGTPAVMVVCNECAHIDLFAAKLIGIV